MQSSASSSFGLWSWLKFDIAFSLSESIPDRGDWKPEGEIVDGVVKTAQGGGDGKEIGC